MADLKRFDGSKVAPLTRLMIIENAKINPSLMRPSIRLDEKAPDPYEEPTRDGVCRYTNLVYNIEYTPVTKRRDVNDAGKTWRCDMKKPYKIVCDLFQPKNTARFVDFDDFATSRHPVAVWLARNTNICKATFEVAECNPFTRIPFALNVDAYRKKIGTSVLSRRENVILDMMKKEAKRK